MNPPQALIIEDNDQNMQILGTLLFKQNITHIDIIDPVQVANLLPTISDVAVIFLDLEMPTVNGYDVLKMLKEDARFEGVPVVAYTVHVSEANNAYQAGFHSFLAKPLKSKGFPDQLARILRGERVWDRV